MPIDAWLRGPLREWAESLLSPARLASDGFVRVSRCVAHGRNISRAAELATSMDVLMLQAWRARWA